MKNDSVSLYFDEIKNIPVLNKDEELSLVRLAKEGNEEARNSLVIHNLKLVVNIAKLYSKFGVSFEDLIEEGNLELFKCINYFDESFGGRFSTYAYYRINFKLKTLVIRDTGLIKLPRGKSAIMVKINRYKNDYYEKYGRWLSNEEIADIFDIDLDIVNKIYNTTNMISLESLKYIDAQIEDTNNFENELLDKYEDEYYINYINNDYRIDEKRKNIVNNYYGLNEEDKELNLRELSEKYSYSHQYIHALLRSGIRKMKLSIKRSLIK